MNTVFYAVNNSVSDHPVVWGAGAVVLGWLLLRPRR
jgi:MYXO-CTERM domain-containing protein